MEQHKQRFYELCEDHISTSARLHSYKFLSKEKHDQIRDALMLQKMESCELGKQFKHWSFKHFVLKKLGEQHVLCSRKGNPVVLKEDAFDTIKK